MSGIKMQTVLAYINQYDAGGKPREYSIEYVKKDGTKSFKRAVRKGGTIKSVEPTETFTSAERTNTSKRLRDQGLIRFIDCDTDKPFDIYQALLTRFNGQQILH